MLVRSTELSGERATAVRRSQTRVRELVALGAGTRPSRHIEYRNMHLIVAYVDGLRLKRVDPVFRFESGEFVGFESSRW